MTFDEAYAEWIENVCEECGKPIGPPGRFERTASSDWDKFCWGMSNCRTSGALWRAFDAGYRAREDSDA